MPRYWYTGAKDRDNLEKSTLDALTGLLWRDDQQVVTGPTDVVHASGYEQPHVELAVQSAEGFEPPSGQG